MRKVSIIGAGAVGATTAYALAKSSLVDDIVIVDLNKDKAWGVTWDILHGLPFLDPLKIKQGEFKDTENSDIIIITVGVPEVVGESRLVPLRKNKDILKNIIPELVKYSPETKFLVVSNPVDIMTYFTLKYSNLPKNKVIGLGTVLDTSRFKALISNDLNISCDTISGYVLGEHGDSQVSIWSSTRIAGEDIFDYAKISGLSLEENYKTNLEKRVKQSAFDVWEKKGPNCYCVADSIIEVVKAILRNENKILTVSSLLTGEYNLDDICISIPTIVNENGAFKTLEVNINEEEKNKLKSSAKLLQNLIKEI